MSIHELLVKDTTYHSIEGEYKGIHYVYFSNIEGYDNLLPIIKYTLPLEIEKAFSDSLAYWDTIYIVFHKENNRYWLTLSLAQSENLNFSHREVIRIIGKSPNYTINTYNDKSQENYFKNYFIHSIYGSPITSPIFLVEK